MGQLDDTPEQPEWLSLVSALVRDVGAREPFYVDGQLDLLTVCRELAERGATDVLVRDGERVGIFTTTDLRDAVLRPGGPGSLAVRDVARYGLVGISPDAEILDALWLMLHHRIHHLLVRDAGGIVGVLGPLDLLDFVAHRAHLIALQIDAAVDVGQLKAAAERIDRAIELLHESGTRIERIARVVGDLNARLFAKLWSLFAPADVIESSCLIVMGSEGRGEQILKTDQDNALILRDGFAHAGLDEIAGRFNAALVELGYPLCPGNIMLTNPMWRQSVSGFRDTLRDWCYGHDPDGPMHLAIFMDAVAVAGDRSLLERAREHVDQVLTTTDMFLARFARAVDQFSQTRHWWSRFDPNRDEMPLDLKKLGTFPIVHGVRALSLRHGVREVSTAERLRALCALGVFGEPQARDLIDALHCLMKLKLASQLRQRSSGVQPDNQVRPADLGTLERDGLRSALAIVDRFRAMLVLEFQLDRL